MKKLKRSLALLIALCVAFSLAACGASGASSAAGSSVEAVSAEEAATAGSSSEAVSTEETAGGEAPAEAPSTEGDSAAEASADDDGAYAFQRSGITLNVPPEFANTHGVIVPYGDFDLTEGAGIYATSLLYFALDQEAFDTYTENTEPTQEEFDRFWNSRAFLFMILSSVDGLSIDEINAYADGELDPASARLICSVEGCTHYLYDVGESLPEGTDAVFLEEFEALKGLTDEVLAGSEFGKPMEPDPVAGMAGSRIRFETTDTEGNPVSSEELFGAHEITMVNIWTSWCGFCIDEMEELEAINKRLAEKDCAVVGLLADGSEEEALASGRETLREKGVTYTNILPPDDLEELFSIEAYPTTYFVDREGVIIGAPIIGARIDQYEPMIEALLSGNASAAESLQEEPSEGETEEGQVTARVETNDDSLYRVIVVDEDGNPVSGVTVQFCSETACMMGETDETGTAVFKEPLGRYSVHILKAPEEYTVDEAEYYLEAFADLTIYLFRE